MTTGTLCNGAHLDDCDGFDDVGDDCGVFDDYDDDCGVFDDVGDDDLFQEETLTVECTKKQCPPLTDCLHRWDCRHCHHYHCKIFIFIDHFCSEAVRVHPLDCCKVCPAQVTIIMTKMIMIMTMGIMILMLVFKAQVTDIK